MTQEDKELLLTDLCARLPYGVNVYCEWNYFQGERTNDNGILVDIDLHKNNILFKRSSDEYTHTRIPFNRIDGVVKPYLRPMSSMTEEEYNEYELTFDNVVVYSGHNNNNIHSEHRATYETFDYLNSHHFDYRGLIEKGLALPATEGMYKIN